MSGCSSFRSLERRFSFGDPIFLKNTLSPNGESRIIVYHYDNGATGYSRAFWAITPEKFQDYNLVEYELPDGYKTEGWTNENEIMISKWKPYYYIEEKVDIKTGDLFNGVKVKLVENSDDKKE